MANNATVLALLDNLRVRLPGAGDDAIALELFNTVDEVAREALDIAAPTNVDTTDFSTWLPDAQWVPNYQVLLNGTLARMYAQASKPYSSPDLAKSHFDLYLSYLERARSEASGGVPATVYARLLADLRTRLPGVRDAAINREIYIAVDKIRREALRIAPLDATFMDPSAYLTTANYTLAYQAVLHGSLFGMYGQSSKAWSSAELAKTHFDLFQQELVLLRGDPTVSTTTTVYDRLLSNLRTQAPLVRDEILKLELFNVIDKIRREALRLPRLDATFTDPTLYLPTAIVWAQCYQTALHGALFGLFSQVGKAWSSPDLAKAHFAQYQDELSLVRGEAASSPSDSITRLMDGVRLLPGARDEIIKLELFSALDEFLQRTNFWQVGTDYAVVAGQTSYVLDLSAQDGVPISLMSHVNSVGANVAATMSMPGTVVLGTTPTQVDVFTATVSYTVADPVGSDGYPQVPDELLQKYGAGVLAGVVGRMMSQPAKPYTNERLSIFNLRKFTGAIAEARAAVRHQNLYGGQTWRFPQFAAGRQR